MDPGDALIFVSMLDRLITAAFSLLKALKTDDAQVEAAKVALISKMKTLPDFEPPEVESLPVREE